MISDMKLIPQKILFITTLLLSIISGYYLFCEISVYDGFSNEGCTIGVVSANSTSDGRPLLWKIRDNSDFPNNEVIYDSTCKYKFIAVVNNGDSSVWMGVNEKGLSIVNSTSKDLPMGNSGYSNGTLMRAALGYCGSVQEFENLLLITNLDGRKTRANFALIDSTDAAVIFETSGNQFWKFDANNPKQAPNGYLIRTNFSITGGGREGVQRYNRTAALIESLYNENNLNYKNLIEFHLRDFSDALSNPVDIPYMYDSGNNKPFGYFNTNYSVCRSISISASIIRGTKSNEPSDHTTMWATIGQPASTIILPFWPVGETPVLSRGKSISPLFRIASEIKTYLFNIDDPNYVDSYKLRDDLGKGILNQFKKVENEIIERYEAIAGDNKKSAPEDNELLLLENELSEMVYSELAKTKLSLSSLIKLHVMNTRPYDSLDDNYSFRDGCLIQLIDAGENGIIDQPVDDHSSDEFGMPGGDDRLVGRNHFLGENSEVRNSFYFPVMLWKEATDLPDEGNKIYLRIFDRDVLADAEYYGDAQLYKILARDEQEYRPEIIYIKSFGPEEGGDRIASITDWRGYELYQNFPNPFNPSTKIKFTIPTQPSSSPLLKGRTEEGFVTLKIYDVLGNEIATLINEQKPAGTYEVVFDAGLYNLSSGIYFYKLTAGHQTQNKKMLFIK